MMAGKRHPLGIQVSWCLVLLAAGFLWIDALRGQDDDDASFGSRSENRSPRSSFSGNAPPRNDPSNRRPTSVVTEEEGQQRPGDNAVLEVQKLTPELEAILDNWEEKTSRITKLKGSFVKTSYDNVFEVQMISKGEFMYEAPDKGYYMFESQSTANIKPKTNKDGVPYQLQEEKDEKWYCTGDEIYQLNVEARTFDRVNIPEENRGKNIVDGPLPFLFGMKKEQAVRRYQLTLLKSNERQVWIGVRPKLQHDLANYSEAKIILDARTYLPFAVKLLDPPGTKETVHVFEGVTTQVFKWPLRDPFRPNLLGYKPVVKDNVVNEDLESIRRAPNGGESNEGPIRSLIRPRTAQQRESGM